ncbi:MAG: ribosome recycling factor [Candidatus Margulisbacteria bacterium]|nr:ribosome recycling factor [Candidatus Margulisiibacteriota bacterium]MBU1021957.1 ribosome recycling factor [Candidatus Margulisiibacteriota bacterium]MBU1728936.1 ribosome recycling factor [Candidatus Margulisiibacteriota bacterium]MBU1954742.1 ribosome recycling factor [Candidatus Margulisiibacteriota bacterium]
MSDVISQAEQKMKKAFDVVKKNFSGVRTGRASAALLDHVTVEYYGTKVPLIQLAGISVPESRLIVVQPYDKNSVKLIEKALQTSDIGINPVSEGGKIRLPLPQPTEERRKELVKVLKKEAEEGKVAIRNIRRDAMTQLKKQKDAKEISEDAEKNQEEAVQKLVDRFTKEIDSLLKTKEKEVMEV